jgi:uncharacterized protein with von Willebrand factor type A (vWA) domain
MADDPAFVDLLVEFGHELRAAGMTPGSGDLLTYCSAAAILNPADIIDLYWAGRATLVTRREQIPVYDRVFHRFFLGEPDGPADERKETIKVASGADAVLQVPEAEPGAPGAEDDQAQLGFMASGAEVWRHKSFAACTPAELAAVRRIMTRMRLTPPRRRTRRRESARSGRQFDLRRTARETMRHHGEPAPLLRRRRTVRVRPLVLILDVSGSMSEYSRHLLQFAYSATRAAGRVEVFCFGTRLTRITAQLQRRRPDDALDRAARSVFDWDGGTRIGDSLSTFVNQWGRRGLSRGAIVVICSDGLDRGDPAVLDRAMERLARLSYRIIWMNPHKGNDERFRPSTLAMMVAEPHIDLVLSGHNLRSFEEFSALLPGLR